MSLMVVPEWLTAHLHCTLQPASGASADSRSLGVCSHDRLATLLELLDLIRAADGRFQLGDALLLQADSILGIIKFAAKRFQLVWW
jgi:hypothetical protein